jgi:hypothetical protein
MGLDNGRSVLRLIPASKTLIKRYVRLLHYLCEGYRIVCAVPTCSPPPQHTHTHHPFDQTTPLPALEPKKTISADFCNVCNNASIVTNTDASATLFRLSLLQPYVGLSISWQPALLQLLLCPCLVR